MAQLIFRDRDDAARQLAEKLRAFDLHRPLVLGIPRGGVVTAAILARELNADMDAVFARKLRHPWQPELAIGAVSEDGEVYLGEGAELGGGTDESYIEQERKRRLEELKQRSERFRNVRPAAPFTDRSVIITDDGIATGSTMLAALHVVKAKGARQTIVAVPVGPPERLEKIRAECDELVCLSAPVSFMAIGQFYESFEQVDDDTVCDLLREFATVSG